MNAKRGLGLLITILSVAVLFYGFLVTGGEVKGDIALAVGIGGFALILIGPWLWLGDVPTAIKKFVEAKTGTKLEPNKPG